MFEYTFVSALLANEDITEYVGEQIDPITTTQTAQRPYLTYSLNQSEPVSQTFSGPSKTKWGTYDVITVADTYDDCLNLSNLVQRTLNGLAVTTDNVIVHWTKYEDSTDIEQRIEPGTEKPLYVRSDTFKAMYVPIE